MSQEQLPMFIGPVARKALVIYHAHCNDGFGAAWSFHRNAAHDYGEVEYHAANYGEEPPFSLCSGRDVFILDFSYPSPQLMDIHDLATYTVLLDHHKTAFENLNHLVGTLTKGEILLDNDRSGAMIAWNYFSGNPAPALVRYIQDRDLWLHKEPWTKEINALIGMTDRTFDAYTALHRSLDEGQFYQCTMFGELLLKQHTRNVSSIIEATKRPFSINGHEGLICNCPGQFASDVGHELANETGTFGGPYFAAADGSHKFSLRSIGDFDVSAIAKQFGGGGHKNAAGFSITDPIPDAGGSGVTLWNIS